MAKKNNRSRNQRPNPAKGVSAEKANGKKNAPKPAETKAPAATTSTEGSSEGPKGAPKEKPTEKKDEAPRPRTVAGQIIEDTSDTKEEESHSEDNLELRSMSRRQRWAVKKERIRKELEGRSRMEKVSYLLYYFKMPIIFTVSAILITTLLVVSIVINKRPVGLSAAIVNLPSDKEVTEANFEDYLSNVKLNYKTSVKLNTDAQLDLDTADEIYRNNPYDYSVTQFPVLCTSDFFDVIITNRKGLDYCSYCNIIFDPETIISPYTVLSLRDHEVQAADSTGTKYFYAYDITNTDFGKSLDLGMELYLCFPGQSDTNKENAERFLRYVYQLPDEEQ